MNYLNYLNYLKTNILRGGSDQYQERLAMARSMQGLEPLNVE